MTALRRFLRERRGFTLTEIVLALALAAMIFAAGILLFRGVFRLTDNTAALAYAQSAAETRMTLITRKLRYASFLSVENASDELPPGRRAIWSEGGEIYLLEGDSGPEPLISDLASKGYEFSVNFFSDPGSKVLTVRLTVSREGRRLHRLETVLHPENSGNAAVAGAESGDRVSFLPPENPAYAEP